jgi:hypothetical protein
MCYRYRRDEEQIRNWVEASKEAETSQAFLERYVYGVADHTGYLRLFGEERLAGLREQATGGRDV